MHQETHQGPWDPPHWHPLCIVLWAITGLSITIAIGLGWFATTMSAGATLVLFPAGLLILVALNLAGAAGSFHRGRERKGAIRLIVALILAATGLIIISPTGNEFFAILPLLIMAIALPYLRLHALLWLLAASWVVAMTAVVANTLWIPPAPIPPLLDLMLRTIGYIAILTLTITLLYRHHRQTHETIERVHRESQALKEARNRLETTHQALTSTQQHFEASNRSLEKTRHRLDSSNRAVGRFLNSAAHDLFTPMTPIMIHTEMLRRDPQIAGNANVQRSLDVIERNLARLKAHVDDLVDAAMLRSDQYTFHLKDIPLDPLLQELDMTFTPIATQNKIRFKTKETGIRIHADPDRVMQALSNLVIAALDNTPHGGMIQVTAKKADGDCVIHVIDTGKGLDPQTAEQIFNPFTTAGDPSRHIKSGLGLYVTRSVIEGHGGTIRCTSPGPGKGTVFRFTLPLAQTSDETDRAHEAHTTPNM